MSSSEAFVLVPEIGKRYRLEASDCCLSVTVEGVLVSFDARNWSNHAAFDNGAVVDCDRDTFIWTELEDGAVAP